MIIFIFLCSAGRLSHLSSPTRAAMTHSRVNGEKSQCPQCPLWQANAALQHCTSTGTNGNKWEQMAACLPQIPVCWRWDEKKKEKKKNSAWPSEVWDWSKLPSGIIGMKKKIGSCIDFKWEVGIWGRWMKSSRTSPWGFSCAGWWMDGFVWSKEVLVCEGPKAIKGVWASK